jgi:LuxR family transcriptional regulator, maltose regulon positive regulatory protein
MSVLATKICLPPLRPHSISRPRLVARLEEGAGYDLVLVSAPAGFGKTTLLGEWARRTRQAGSTIWLSLDEADNDPIRFWDHFIAALAPLGPDAGQEALALLHAPVPLPPESFLVALVNSLAGIAREFAVVLDDYHAIQSPPIHQGISFLIDHMPAAMQLIIAGRADPPLPLARYRGGGSMLEIGADDLRFTPEEAASLLGELLDVLPSPQDVAALTRRTGGWAVGLKMAALSMRETEDASAFISLFTGSHRFVMDYLMEEVLQRQPDEVQRFLLETSVLDTFTAPLCDAVTGMTGSESVLGDLELANLFVSPLDDSRTWYRYERLFADLLRHQLERTANPAYIADLHIRAGRWYEEHGLPRDAIDHSLAAHDWDKALDLLACESHKQLRTGEMVTLLGWLQLIPDDALKRRPQLRLSYADALMLMSQLDAAEEVLDDLEREASSDDGLRGGILAARAVIALARGEEDAATELSREALRLLPPEAGDARGMLSLHLGSMYFFEKGLLKEGEALLREAHRVGRQSKQLWIELTASDALCCIAFLRGRLGQAIQQARRDIELAGSSPAAAYPHGHLASSLYQRNELDSATYHLDKSIEIARPLAVGPNDWETSYYVRMQISLARGDVAGALEAVDQIDLWASRGSSRACEVDQACAHLTLALRRGDAEQASRWAPSVADCGGPVFYHGHLLLVPLLLLQGRNDRVEAQIRAFYDRLQLEFLGAEWPYWRIKARIYQALAAPDWSQARGFFADALALARPEGYVRALADEGPALAPFLRKAISEGVEPQFAAMLLTLIETEDGLLAGRASTHKMGAPGVLSERELEVLRLVAAGMSNREIAQRLFISPGTVKVHLYNICDKLNTAGRAKAVLQARELHLI